MNLFEEANQDISRAMELGEPDAAVELAREALREATRLGMGDLASQLQYFIEVGMLGGAFNVITAMGAKQQELDVDQLELTLHAVQEMGGVELSALSGYNCMN